MTIRALKTEDYAVIDTYMQELHTLHVNGRPDLYLPLEHPYSRDEFCALVCDEKRIAIAMVDETNQILGFCIASLKDKSGMVTGARTVYIDEMFVRRDVRRQGIAKELFRCIEKRAREKGAVRIDLMVWEFNQSAKELYETMGMTVQRTIMEKQL